MDFVVEKHHFRRCFSSFAGTISAESPGEVKGSKWVPTSNISSVWELEMWKNIRFLFIVVRYIKIYQMYVDYYLSYIDWSRYRSAEDAKIRIPTRDGCRCALRQPTMALWNGFALLQALRQGRFFLTDLPKVDDAWSIFSEWCMVRRYLVFSPYVDWNSEIYYGNNIK